MQKRPQRELARVCRARAQRKHQRKHAPGDIPPAVAVDFRHVFPRVGMRGGQKHGHGLVNGLARVHHVPIGQHPVPLGRRRKGARENLPRARPANADDGHATFPRGRCNGGYRIVWNHSRLAAPSSRKNCTFWCARRIEAGTFGSMLPLMLSRMALALPSPVASSTTRLAFMMPPTPREMA